MPREVYYRWAALDQYGMFASSGSSSSSAARPRACSRARFEHVLRVISAIVGGHPLI